MKNNAFIVLVLVMKLVSCGSGGQTAEESKSEPNINIEKAQSLGISLTKAWETDTILDGTECVLFDPSSKLLYVSNIAGSEDILAMDGNGFIAQVDLDGNIVNRNWITGLNSPKGMALKDGKLYVSDGVQVVVVDVAKSAIVETIAIEGAIFLNDIAIDLVGVVYVSDSKTNKVYAIKDGQVDVYANLVSPNGLLDESTRILSTTIETGEFGAFDKETGEYSVLTSEIGAGDGITSDGKGNYIISSWKGEVFFIDGETYKKTSLLKTEELGINTADLTYVVEKNLLLIPTFFANTVAAYKLHGN